MGFLSQAQKWIRYRRKAITRYRVHSPFLFAFINDVVRARNDGPWREADRIRRQWSRRSDSLVRRDLGAGARAVTAPECIGRIVSRQGMVPKYGRLLYRMVSTMKPQTILELGTSVGIGTSYLAVASAETKITSVEGCPATHAVARTHPLLQRDGIRLLCDDFDHALAQFSRENQRFDMVFVDGDHSYEGTLRYFQALRPLLHPGSIVVFDDIHWSEGMEAAWQEIKKEPEVTLSLDMFRFGLVFLKKELSKQDIILRF